MLDVLVYMNALDRGLHDAAAFDGAVIVAIGLVALVLRPGFVTYTSAAPVTRPALRQSIPRHPV